jgi:metal-responsive CopG/Arc/MetJ family transcriptional regulator
MDSQTEVPVDVFLDERLARRVDRFRRSTGESRVEVVAAAVERLVESR